MRPRKFEIPEALRTPPTFTLPNMDKNLQGLAIFIVWRKAFIEWKPGNPIDLHDMVEHYDHIFGYLLPGVCQFQIMKVLRDLEIEGQMKEDSGLMLHFEGTSCGLEAAQALKEYVIPRRRIEDDGDGEPQAKNEPILNNNKDGSRGLEENAAGISESTDEASVQKVGSRPGKSIFIHIEKTC